MRIWITRTQPEADATAARVQGLGHEPLVGPVLRVEHLPAAPDLQGVSALAFSSRHAVEAFVAGAAWPDLPVFVTGQATARAARLAGFRSVRSADGDGRDLAALIADAWPPSRGVILHPAAAEPAFDLAAALAASGVRVQTYAAYRTVPADAAPVLVAALEAGALHAVLVHSARAGAEVARLLRDASCGPLRAYAISPSAAHPLAGSMLAALHVADQPTEAALLALLPVLPSEAHP